VPSPCQVRLRRFPGILKPTPLRKPIDFISNLFAKIKNLSFCDQAPFQIRFKRHCTGQCLDCVLSRTVRTHPLPSEAASFPRNPETDGIGSPPVRAWVTTSPEFQKLKPIQNHRQNTSKTLRQRTSFDHLKGRVHDLAILSRTVCKLSRPGA
jgi:hypothetical protein